MKRLISRRKTKWLKFGLQCVYVLFVSIAVLLIGIGMSKTHIDLNHAGHSTGKLSSVKLTANKNGRSNLTIQLLGDEHAYSLYRFSQDYQPLIRRLEYGAPTTIYYNPTFSTAMNYEIYQISTPNGIVYAKDEYERSEQVGGRYWVIPVSLVLFVAGFFSVRKSYRKLTAN